MRGAPPFTHVVIQLDHASFPHPGEQPLELTHAMGRRFGHLRSSGRGWKRVASFVGAFAGLAHGSVISHSLRTHFAVNSVERARAVKGPAIATVAIARQAAVRRSQS